MLTIRAMSDGKGYSSRHLEHSDYYAEGERVTGVWQGRGAELLGLSGSVATEEFEALRQGRELQRGLGDDAQRALAADKELAQIEAGVVLLEGADGQRLVVGVVFDEKDDLAVHGPVLRPSVKKNVAPRSTALSAQISPPCLRTRS